MARAALIGLDLGTSGVKALVIALDGTQLGEADHPHPVVSPEPGWAETAPMAWWEAAVSAVRAARKQAGEVEITGIGVDGQMHGLVLTDADATPVRPALLWADQRAEEVMGRWTQLSAPQRARLANPLTPGMTGPLLRWVAEHEPESLHRSQWALLPKDWLRMRLTGRAVTDPSDASATLLWDMPEETWSQPALEACGVGAQLLPPVAASASCAGSLSEAAATELGLPPGISVATGTGDTPAAVLAGGLAPGQAQITVGSGAQIVVPVAEPTPAPGVHVYRTADDSGWYRMAAVQNAGLALEWLTTLLAATWDELYASVEYGRPGADGVTFVPHLTGERTPILDASATGSLLGLRLGTDRAALLRAGVEGVALSLRHAATALAGGLPDQVRLAGGGSHHPAFRRLLADVLNVELHPIRLRSASALGAAILAARAAGLDDPHVQPEHEAPVLPGERAAAYDEIFQNYLDSVRR
ncbi:xylulokinase [Salinactinospora qingdaonensis]|uniref:FGGY family carbohydrate kinase n=1 Tax=Salinactinospora qingdaonensis TaxID=702744 RepID=A0ABP7GIX4_9ACTN